jgi:hypothetical protein
MDLFFHCDNCGHGLSIDESCAGLVMKCIYCSASIIIPSPTALATEAVKKRSEPAMAAVPTASAPAVICPSCREPIHEDRKSCAGCGNPLPAQDHAPRSPQATWLAVACATLVGLILGADLVAITEWKKHKGRATMHAMPMANANLSRHHEATAPGLDPSFTITAMSVMTSLQQVQLAVKADADRGKYIETLGGVMPKLDEFLRVADETGLYKSNPDVRDFCAKASSAFLTYNRAREQWDTELLQRLKRDTVRLAHETVVATATDKAAVDQSLKETTDKLNDLTVKVMKAMESRYDLWLNAEKETQAAAEVLVRLKDL